MVGLFLLLAGFGFWLVCFCVVLLLFVFCLFFLRISINVVVVVFLLTCCFLFLVSSCFVCCCLLVLVFHVVVLGVCYGLGSVVVVVFCFASVVVLAPRLVIGLVCVVYGFWSGFVLWGCCVKVCCVVCGLVVGFVVGFSCVFWFGFGLVPVCLVLSLKHIK